MHVRKCTTIYFGKPGQLSYEDALLAARLIRRRELDARIKREKQIKPTSKP